VFPAIGSEGDFAHPGVAARIFSLNTVPFHFSEHIQRSRLATVQLTKLHLLPLIMPTEIIVVASLALSLFLVASVWASGAAEKVSVYACLPLMNPPFDSAGETARRRW
jgi:hypothetical protein